MKNVCKISIDSIDLEEKPCRTSKEYPYESYDIFKIEAEAAENQFDINMAASLGDVNEHDRFTSTIEENEYDEDFLIQAIQSKSS